MILGIDPGTRKCGYAIIDGETALDYGVIRPKASLSVNDRLKTIFLELKSHCENVDVIAFESNFVGRYKNNIVPLAKLQGGIIALSLDVPVYEYSPTQVKQSVYSGRATKAQVQLAVTSIFRLRGEVEEDAADALAVAMCHYNKSRILEIKKQKK